MWIKLTDPGGNPHWYQESAMAGLGKSHSGTVIEGHQRILGTVKETPEQIIAKGEQPELKAGKAA